MISTYSLKKIDRHFKFVDERTLGIAVGFLKRAARKLTPLIFLKALCLAYSNGSISYADVAFILSALKKTTVSKQALSKRIGLPMVNFCKNVLMALISNQIVITNNNFSFFSSFNRVLLQDSTPIQLNHNLKDKYPGPANKFSEQYATAKIQTILDIKQNAFVQMQITPFVRNDQSASPDILDILKQGDLVIRDLGYFVLSIFKKINERKAFFISRLRHNTCLFDQNLQRFELLDNLCTSEVFDKWLFLGAEEKMKVRVVCIPLSEQYANERRRKLKLNRDRRLNPSKKRLALCSWALFITNVTEDVLSAEQIKFAYKLRWRIEIVFKSWKTHFKLNTCNIISNEYFSEIIMYTRLINILIFYTVIFVPLLFKAEKQGYPYTSLLKTANLVSKNFTLLLEHIDTKLAFKLLTYFCSYEKRKNRLNYPQQILLS